MFAVYRTDEDGARVLVGIRADDKEADELIAKSAFLLAYDALPEAEQVRVFVGARSADSVTRRWATAITKALISSMLHRITVERVG